MFITKTDFIAYSRCPKYAKYYYENKYDNSDPYERELANKYSDNNDEYLNIMLPYYKKVEELTATDLEDRYNIPTHYSDDTLNQKSFCFNRNDYQYLCFVDVYQEDEDEIRIVEVKATTDKKLSSIGGKNSPFIKLGDIYYLKEDLGLVTKSTNKDKLYDRFGDGKYIYDLAIQKWIIENSLANKKTTKKFKYYLALLNHQYVYNGKTVNNNPFYERDSKGNSLIVYFDLTNFLDEYYMDKITNDANKIEELIASYFDSKTKLGNWCNQNGKMDCPLINECMAKVPTINSVLSYKRNNQGFIINGKRIKGLDLINEGYYHMLDIPSDAITDSNHLIQRKVCQTHQEYINVNKLKRLMDTIEYPIYHLDFETFPCPLPRFKGESPYSQSVFEFSLHIEHKPGYCDKDLDHYLYIASDFKDHREDMLAYLFKYVDPSHGTLLAQNISFEKGRLEELANIFPQYKRKIQMLTKRCFDLLWLLDTNVNKYEQLGYSHEEAKVMNFYHEQLDGSFSIKKTLPLFSDLSYNDLKIHNGNEAIIAYAKYPLMSNQEINLIQENLYEYCKQDTWAMVVILDGLRKKVNNGSN